MATGKTSTLTFRIAPALKEALRTAADREDRHHRLHGAADRVHGSITRFRFSCRTAQLHVV